MIGNDLAACKLVALLLAASLPYVLCESHPHLAINSSNPLTTPGSNAPYDHLSSTTDEQACTHETFQLFDGYEFMFDSTSDSRNHFHFIVDSLHECVRRCAEDGQCRAVNYDGHTCQQLELRLEGRLVHSRNRTSSFTIYAEKICISGMSLMAG